MLESRELTSLRQHFQKNEEMSRSYDGANRRTVGLLPDSKGEQSSPIAVADQANRHRLLVSLEAAQTSCCIKIASEKRKTRGAVLIFRGRVLGAVYGSKDSEQLFDRHAYANVSSDILHSESVIDAYTLPDELVIAAGSLFHGQQFQFEKQDSAVETFKTYFQALLDSNMPGCIVVTDQRSVPVCIAYIFAGKLVGLYGVRDGWLPPMPSVAFARVARNNNATVAGSMLRARNVEEVEGLTFSLSGLADRSVENWTGIHNQLQEGLRIPHVDTSKLQARNKPVTNDRFIPIRPRLTGKLHSNNRQPFSI